MTRALLASLAALALSACSHQREKAIGPQPTPLYVQGAGATQSEESKKLEKMGVQGPHGGTTAEEMDGNGKPCSTNKDCEGRLRCVEYRGVTGREIRQCLFSCLEGCPEGWTCQTHMADGPNYTCERTR